MRPSSVSSPSLPATPALRWLTIALGVLALVYGLTLLPSHGTPDMDLYWTHWLAATRQWGLPQAYAAIGSDYPPLAIAHLWLGDHLLPMPAADPVLRIKAILLLALFIATAVFAALSRHALATALFCIAQLTGTLGLAYLDIFMGLWIVMAFLLLQQGWRSGFLACLAIALLTKWQTLILMPPLLLYFMLSPAFAASTSSHPASTWRRVAALMPLPLVILAIAAWFDIPTTVRAWQKLQHDMQGSFFNAQALGAQALLDSLIQLRIWFDLRHMHDQAQALAHYLSLESLTRISDGAWSAARIRVSQGLCAIGLLAALYRFIRSDKQTTDFLLSAIVTCIVYFIFHTGVHENHLYLAMLLAWVLVAHSKRHWRIALWLTLLHNLNMVYYYGFTGSWPANTGASAGIQPDWPTLALAALLCSSLLCWCYRTISLRR